MPMDLAACSRPHWHTFHLLVWAMWPRQVGDKYANARGCMQPPALAYFSPYLSMPTRKQQKAPEQCSPEPSSIQVNVARLGLDGLSAEELAKLGWAPDVACGHLPLLSSCHPVGTVSCNFIEDITSSSDVWGEGEDILKGCVRH